MTRRLLLAAGGGASEPSGPIPADPTLTETRGITRPFAININGSPTTPTGGRTWQFDPISIIEDSADLRLVFLGILDVGQTLKVAIRRNSSGAFAPVLFSGAETASLPLNVGTVSDAIAGPFLQGDTVTLRVYAPAGQTVNVASGSGSTGTVMDGADRRLETNWFPTEPYPASGPLPVVIQGTSRASVVTVGGYGDSILAQQTWFLDACAENGLPGANYGRNVQQFTGRWLDGAIDGITHMLSQFAVNDINSGVYGSALWDRAVACYAYIDGLRPGLPIWQTTTTPIVSDTAGDGCATLVGQTLDATTNTRRQDWIAFLRDGAPCDPSTKAQLAVGATGTAIRAGQTGHPLKGIVDIAAAVEEGGASAPTGKWRVNDGPFGGDGVHPDPLGMAAMAVPVSAWMATLT